MNRFKKYFLAFSLLLPMLSLTVFGADEIVSKYVISSGSMIKSIDNANKTQMYGTFGTAAAGHIKLYGTSTSSDLYLGFWGHGEKPTDVNDNTVSVNNVLRNYPNPVSNSTTIEYNLPAAANVTIKIYDISGKLLNVIYDGYQNAGVQNVEYDAVDSYGTKLTSGSYVYELVATPFNLVGSDAFEPIQTRNIMVIAK